MKKQHWVTAALSNDTIVADFLIRMKQHTTCLLPPITWGHRKSRSKPPDAVSNLSGSPTTPLHWNSDGYEDLSSGAAAKGNEETCKSKKRKSFAQLKEEEDFLIKERHHLNRELESTMGNQIATSHNLKKLKIGMHTKAGFVLPDLNMVPDRDLNNLYSESNQLQSCLSLGKLYIV